jgi:hypothetical protein
MQKFTKVAQDRCKIQLTSRTKAGKAKKSKVKQVYYESKVYYTSDFDHFVLKDTNRLISKADVINKMDGISRDGAPTPINCKRVGDKLLVLDGQHRLTACFYLGYKIPYVLIQDNLPKGIDEDDYIRHLNTGQRNWTGNDYQRSALNKGTELYNLINDLSKKHVGLDKSSSTKVLFNNSKIMFKQIHKLDDVDYFMDNLDISYNNMKVNSAMFDGILNALNTVFKNPVMMFIEGFTNFALDIDNGIKNNNLYGFVEYLSDHIDEYEWNPMDLPPQKTSQWTTFFDIEWKKFEKTL